MKVINLLVKAGYIKENILFDMNFKERGITVGDLLIILIITISAYFIVAKVKNNEKNAYFYESYEIKTSQKDDFK